MTIRRERGFTLLEVMIAMALGLLVIGGAALMYRDGLAASWLVTQRSEMQLDVRAAQNMLTRDIRRAGYGLNPGGVALVTGATVPIYGCDQNACYLPVGATPAGISFPLSSSAPTMFWMQPGYQKSATITAANGPNDAITVVYADSATSTSANLANYTITFNNANGTSMAFTLKGTTTPPVVALTDPVAGLKAGDLLLFSNLKVSTPQFAVGEVTAAPTGSGPYTVLFSDPDKLKMNQSAGTSNGLKQLATGTGTSAQRIYMVSYYLDTSTDPSGNAVPRLMRQVSGFTPIPVSEYVVDLHFTYEGYDDNGLLATPTPTPANLTQIQRVDVNMTSRSSLRGAYGYQGIQLNWTIGAQNMSFSNRYPI
jgi:prepilin-type N-terminal cleavage/methylation domain-containing protein